MLREIYTLLLAVHIIGTTRRQGAAQPVAVV
jgi:hypothetical protein